MGQAEPKSGARVEARKGSGQASIETNSPYVVEM